MWLETRSSQTVVRFFWDCHWGLLGSWQKFLHRNISDLDTESQLGARLWRSRHWSWLDTPAAVSRNMFLLGPSVHAENRLPTSSLLPNQKDANQLAAFLISCFVSCRAAKPMTHLTMFLALRDRPRFGRPPVSRICLVTFLGEQFDHFCIPKQVGGTRRKDTIS